MFRPPKMKEEDFVEMMKEIVPKLLDEAAQAASSASSSSAGGSQGTKREFVPSPEDVASEPPLSRAKPSVEDDSLVVEAEHECLLVDEVLPIMESWWSRMSYGRPLAKEAFERNSS